MTSVKQLTSKDKLFPQALSALAGVVLALLGASTLGFVTYRKETQILWSVSQRAQ